MGKNPTLFPNSAIFVTLNVTKVCLQMEADKRILASLVGKIVEREAIKSRCGLFLVFTSSHLNVFLLTKKLCTGGARCTQQTRSLFIGIVEWIPWKT